MAELTGRKVLAIAVGTFGVIIAVNIVMAVQAIKTFPGLEVQNGYIASQTFDAERQAQQALGWTLTSAYDSKTLSLRFADAAGQPVTVKSLNVLVGRTTEAREDSTPEFMPAGGVYSAPIDLRPGKWMLRVEAVAQDGTLFRQRLTMYVKG